MIESPERIKDCDKLVGHILSMQYRPAQVNKAWKFAQRYFQLGYDLGMRKARAKQQHLTTAVCQLRTTSTLPERCTQNRHKARI